MIPIVTRAFWGLYTDEAVQGPFVAYWEKLDFQIAQTFAPHSNIIGYELLNEPFIASKSSAGVPYNLWNRANTERKYLVPLYDRLAKAIRRHDQRTLLWWEPVTGGGSNAGEGFDRVPGIEDGGAEKSVMSFHSYGPNLVDGDTMEGAVQKRIAQVAKIGGAAVGSPPSGTLWDPQTSLLRPPMVKLFSRPFPTSVAGRVESYGLDWDTNTFRLAFFPSGAGWTRIGMNEDTDSGWGEWVPKIEADHEADLSKVIVQKGWGEVLVSAGKEWIAGQRLVLVLTLKPIT
ncbi:hypothetical protein P7C70_g1637, partial [Phenoliferia sp. Uapishka_3]